VVARLTDAHPDATDAYHLVQPTPVGLNGKKGLVCKQRAGTVTVFWVCKHRHTSSRNEHRPNDEFPSLGVGFVQQTKLLNTSQRRANVFENMVDFSILDGYHY